MHTGERHRQLSAGQQRQGVAVADEAAQRLGLRGDHRDDLARRAAAAEPKLGAALAPYPLWCGFATVMTTHIWRLNR